MRKYLVTIVIAFLIGLSFAWGQPAAAAAQGGSASDPLVAKSWADDYISRQFAAIQTQLDEIKAQLAAGGTKIVLTINSSTYTVNGQEKTMDTAAVINSDWRTLVPIRFVAEALGCTVDYTTKAGGSTDQVIIKGSAAVVLTVGSTAYTVDGVSRTMDTAPVINSDWRTLVPVRFVAEALGCRVDYATDNSGRTTAVYISK
ncbi:MAG: copper amine oxidase N-terminal domain-containing protein [Firmicutes bacterium]|nr:copper amine oxidase N-terminal domain-containing protein [Bacillota bacterium]